MENRKIKIEGYNQAMLLLHGWGVTSALMQPLFEYYKKQYKVCMLDLPGFGENSNLTYAYDLNEYVKVIRDIIVLYELDNPIIIAHSFGARIAFAYASIYDVKMIIASGAAGIKSKKTFKYYYKVYLYKIVKYLRIKNNMGSNDYRKANPLLKETLVKIVNEDCSKYISKITCPILLVWGESDKETPLWMAYKIKSLNKNVSLVIFENDDHFAYYHQMKRFIRVCNHALEGVL